MRNARGHLTAELRSAKEPTKEQLSRFAAFLEKKYRRKVPLEWKKDESMGSGFKLQAGSDVYDWTLSGRARQFQDHLRRINTGAEDLGDADSLKEMQQMISSIRYAVIVMSSLPIMCLYPFLQKYFVQGVMIGSIKS